MKINDFTEDSPYAMFKRWASKTSQPRQYEKAAQTLHNVLVKKSRNGNLKHGLGYYAQQIGKTFAGIDYRALVDYYKEHYGSEGIIDESRDYDNYEGFCAYCCDKLGIRTIPKISIVDKNLDGAFGHYNIQDKCLTVSSKNRHRADVMRTLAHELVHLAQHERGRELDGATGSSDENQANSIAGILMRNWADKDPALFEFKIEKPDPEDTMGIKRNQMPQVATKDYPEFLDYLKDNGATFSKDTVPADSLKAIQGEFSDHGVEKALKLRKIEKPLIASSDNYIIDGHHRWLAALNTGVDVNIFRVDIPGKQLLQLVKDFPKTTYKDIYTERLVKVDPKGPKNLKKPVNISKYAKRKAMMQAPDDLQEEANDSLVDKFLKATGGKYGKRDMCGPACLDFIDWAKQQGIELKRVRGEFVADEVVSAKADFTPEMKKEFAQSGLDWNSAADRKAWIEQSEYAEEWKRVPHYWTVDKDGNIHDPSGYQQLVKTGLASDLDPSRYIPESINEAKEIEFVCVNPAHDDATKQHEQDALFQALKDVPGVIVYRQDFDIHNSMAAILKSNADVKEIKALAKKHNVKIDLTKNVSDRFIDSLYTGDLEGVTDWYDSDNLNEADEVIPMLYHATYKPFLDSIMKNGLGGKGAQTQWEDSKPGYVYLAKDPEVAVSHAEANEEVPDEYIDNIVVLSIDASQLDQDNLEDDPNVMDDDSTLAYKGIIPTSAFTIMEANTPRKVPGATLVSRPHMTGLEDPDAPAPKGELKVVTKAYRDMYNKALDKQNRADQIGGAGASTVIKTKPKAVSNNVLPGGLPNKKPRSVTELNKFDSVRMLEKWSKKYKRSIDENFKDVKINFTMPNFDYEWGEANRYPEYRKIGKEEWIKLAKTGKAIDVDNRLANNIENTEAGEEHRYDYWDGLVKAKRDRFTKALSSGQIELPIIARYSDGYLELVAGNTRLTGMMRELGRAKAWVYDVPDEVADLQENFKDGKNPGRKGLAKRSGVDCSKSVTDLRKIAKNSSGEKQRMAHWCANMKSGRKK